MGSCHSSRAFKPEPGLGQGMGAQHGHVHEPRSKRSQQNMEQILPGGEGLLNPRNLMDGDGRYARTRPFGRSGSYTSINNHSPPRSPVSRSSSYGPTVPGRLGAGGGGGELGGQQYQQQLQPQGYGSMGRSGGGRGNNSPGRQQRQNQAGLGSGSLDFSRGSGQRGHWMGQGIREEELQELEGSVAAMGVSNGNSGGATQGRRTVEAWREGESVQRR